MRIMPYHRVVVIGAGCAGYATANALYGRGVTDVLLICQSRLNSTSRNTGSDKQTYYKMSLCGAGGDSPEAMAQTLFDGGAMDGDIALAEAANSLKAFYNLERLGVNFPCNEYGEFVGYKTDHDPFTRASSAGPYTSKAMTEALEKQADIFGIKISEGFQAIRLDAADGICKGVFALDLTALNTEDYLVYFPCEAVVAATGGPAVIYENSVYPLGHTGCSSLLLEAGAVFANCAEWQYGIASTKFRWNLSGTYQQALPRFYSLDKNGQEHDFLTEYYGNSMDAVNFCFLKGYQWPFDSAKIQGSSRIDLLIHEQIAKKGRRVYMDFRQNPPHFSLDALSDEAYTYLKNSEALLDTPIDRLLAMNPQAYRLYLDHGIDLKQEPLEIAVCAQHNNGGADVDIHYETSVKNLFAAGECACTLGINRPGGTALNSTQAAAFQIAEYIASKAPESQHTDPTQSAVQTLEQFIKTTKVAGQSFFDLPQKLMSSHFAFRRDIQEMEKAYQTLQKLWNEFPCTWSTLSQLPLLFKCRDMLLVQLVYGKSMLHTARLAGSRGSALVLDHGKPLPENKIYRSQKLLATFKDGAVILSQRAVRPLPFDRTLWFETVWKEYNKRRNI